MHKGLEKDREKRVRRRWHITGGIGCISVTCEGCKNYKERGAYKHRQRENNCRMKFREEKEKERKEGEGTQEKLLCAYCEKEIDIDIPFANEGKELYHITCINLVYKIVPDKKNQETNIKKKLGYYLSH